MNIKDIFRYYFNCRAGIFVRIFLVALLFNQPQLKAANIIDEVAGSLTKNFSANFEEIGIDSLTQTKIVATGRLLFKAGGLMRFEYQEPDDQLVIVGKDKIWIYDKLLNNVTISDLSKLDVVEALVFFRKAKSLSRVFSVISSPKTIVIEAMANQKLLYLKSLDPKHPLAQLHLAYDASSKRIEQIGVIDREDSIRIFKFSDFKYPQELDDDNFVFILPNNVEIIE